jgi:hypothetical protein
MYPDAVQQAVLQNHSDLYRRHERSFPILRIQHGRLSISTVVDAPLGYDFGFDPSIFTPLEQWDKNTLFIA